VNSIPVSPVSTLIGNKIDREDREIPTHVGEDFAQRHSMYYVETSAKEAENVERLFMEIAAELMEVNISCMYKVSA
jgi:GTPase SAR1 family protein